MSGLLDRILSSVKAHEQAKKIVASSITKEERERQEKLKEMQRLEQQRYQQFRDNIRSQLQKFSQDAEAKEFAFPTMERLQRTVVREIADELELVTQAFGIEGVDRFVMVYKKETAPTPEQLATLERKYAGIVEEPPKPPPTTNAPSPSPPPPIQPKHNYREKLAKILKPPHTVIVLNTKKRDKRTIEEIQEQLKQKKKRKATDSASSEESVAEPARKRTKPEEA